MSLRSFGLRLKRARESKGLTQDDVVSRLGASAIRAELEREQRAAAHLRADIEGADLPVDVDALRQAMYSLRDDLSLIDSVPRPELRRRIREALPALYARNGRLVSSPKD